MKKFAMINTMKTSTKGTIYVVAVADSIESLRAIKQEHDEIVMVFEEDGQIYYSRDLDKAVKTFKGNMNALNNAEEIKEEKEMKKFEIAGIEYKYNTETGRYSKTENGKTKRIGKAEYEEAASKPVGAKTIPCESGDHAVELAKLGAGYGIKFVGEEEFKPFDKSEFRNEVDKRDRSEGRFEVCFEYMGRKYWMKDAVEKSSAKKTKKSGRSKKNAAYRKQIGDVEITLTEKQVDFFHHMQDTCFWENGLDSTPWVDVLCDEIGGQFENKPMTVGAMVSTLREKNLIEVGCDRVNGRKAKYFFLTETGKEIAADLGLN